MKIEERKKKENGSYYCIIINEKYAVVIGQF